jgi:hypothetical protein
MEQQKEIDEKIRAADKRRMLIGIHVSQLSKET